MNKLRRNLADRVRNFLREYWGQYTRLIRIRFSGPDSFAIEIYCPLNECECAPSTCAGEPVSRRQALLAAVNEFPIRNLRQVVELLRDVRSQSS